MNTYKVEVVRTERKHKFFTVEADFREDAIDMAEEMAGNYDFTDSRGYVEYESSVASVEFGEVKE